MNASGLLAPEPTWKDTPSTWRPSRAAAASNESTSSASAPYLLPNWHRANLHQLSVDGLDSIVVECGCLSGGIAEDCPLS